MNNNNIQINKDSFILPNGTTVYPPTGYDLLFTEVAQKGDVFYNFINNRWDEVLFSGILLFAIGRKKKGNQIFIDV